MCDMLSFVFQDTSAVPVGRMYSYREVGVKVDFPGWPNDAVFEGGMQGYLGLL